MSEKTELGSRFQEALAYATQLHAGQVRKGSGAPYIAHLLSVAALVLEDGGSEDEAIAALLHDAVEDQGGDTARRAIRDRFGEGVVQIVDGCTDAETVPKPPWRERKERYLASLHHASPEVLRVTTADKLHNARSLVRAYREQGEHLWSRFRGGREGTLWYHRAAAEVLVGRGVGWLAEELQRVVEDLETLLEQAAGR